jgi:tetratricopeptide (TPR) repeat protein
MQSGESGPFRRPLASLSFALNHYFAGGFDQSFSFKATNVAIHAINAILVYFLTLQLAQAPALRDKLSQREAILFASFAAGIWALHPIQLTNVLYVVQRMNSLSASFVIAGLLLFTHGRAVFDSARSKGLVLMISGALGGMTLGMASKENAALLPLFALVIEYTLFRFHTSDRSGRNLLTGFYGLLVALPLLAFAAYATTHPESITDSYSTRNFSVLERVLTEARILWFYVELILLPTNNRLGLFHDDIVLSTGLFTPLSTLFAATGVIAALAVGFAQARRRPIISFAIFWFLAGHLIESSIFGLELAYEHRNYLPSYGILLALTFGVMVLIKDHRPAFLLAPVVICAALGVSTWARAGTWGNIITLANYTAETHPASARASDFAARISLAEQGDITAAIHHTLRGLKGAPNEVGFHLTLQMLLSELGTEVGNNLAGLSQNKPGDSFTLRLPGLDDDIQATLTKNGLRLSHRDSGAETILALLATRPITVHGVVALENMRRCMLEPPQPCARLRAAGLKWFAAAAANTRTARDYRAILSNDAALLFAHTGDLVRALEYSNRAVELLPKHIPYRMGKTEYLIRLGHLDEAGRAIDDIETRTDVMNTRASIYGPQLRKLKALYNEAEIKRDIPPR